MERYADVLIWAGAFAAIFFNLSWGAYGAEKKMKCDCVAMQAQINYLISLSRDREKKYAEEVKKLEVELDKLIQVVDGEKKK